MTKISIKILMFACFCFDLSAMSCVDLSISRSSTLCNNVRIEVKNGSINSLKGEITVSLRSDDSSCWCVLKREDGNEYKQELAVNPDGRDSVLVDLLEISKKKISKQNSCNWQKIKAEFTVKSFDKSGEEHICILSQEYNLSDLRFNN